MNYRDLLNVSMESEMDIPPVAEPSVVVLQQNRDDIELAKLEQQLEDHQGAAMETQAAAATLNQIRLEAQAHLDAGTLTTVGLEAYHLAVGDIAARFGLLNPMVSMESYQGTINPEFVTVSLESIDTVLKKLKKKAADLAVTIIMIIAKFIQFLERKFESAADYGEDIKKLKDKLDGLTLPDTIPCDDVLSKLDSVLHTETDWAQLIMEAREDAGRLSSGLFYTIIQDYRKTHEAAFKQKDFDLKIEITYEQDFVKKLNYPFTLELVSGDSFPTFFNEGSNQDRFKPTSKSYMAALRDNALVLVNNQKSLNDSMKGLAERSKQWMKTVEAAAETDDEAALRFINQEQRSMGSLIMMAKTLTNRGNVVLDAFLDYGKLLVKSAKDGE